MAPHGATLEFAYDGPARARVVADSIAREVGEIDDDRSRTTIDREESTVSLEIEAADPVALRAASNTWLSLIDVAERTAAIGDEPHPASET